ncbi:CbtA family protein [Aureimonas sp. AU12]|uniref:CbtA family protein n=1 Tax=Aureimonas sp. AU12 TaxID=1638161 RepID=UPI000783BF08|nr:CbtA family protein [Aureimonas sp. AU12]
MIVRTLLAALVAGMLAGLAVTPFQHWKTTPLIVAAEVYEDGGSAEHDHAAGLPALVSPAAAHSAAPRSQTHGANEEDAGTTLVASRLLGTAMANIVLGAGFALVLAAASLAVGRPVTVRNGAVWGLAGFAVVSLAPALGLPPELPAMPAGDLAARQLWWVLTVGATAIGLGLAVFAARPAAKLGGGVLMLLPLLSSAPHPADLASPIPPTLAAEFAVASLAVSALLWVAIGVALGFALDRTRRPAALARA